MSSRVEDNLDTVDGLTAAKLGARNHEFLFFSLLLQFTSCGGDLGSSRLDNVVR